MYPPEIRNELLSSDNEPINSVKRKCPCIVAYINNVLTNILIDTGAELSAISQKFINKNKKQFNMASVLPLNNMCVQTAVNTKEKVTKQIFININKDEFNIEIPAIIIKNLIYDAIIGMDQLKNISAILNTQNDTMQCEIYNTKHVLKLNENVEDYAKSDKTMTIHRPDITIAQPKGENIITTDTLNTQESAELKRVLRQNREIFSEKPRVTNVYEHQIITTHEDKFVRRTYPVPIKYQNQVDSEINNMLKHNIIERSNSNFLNPMVIVKKKNDEIRVCLDMRNLNSITQKIFDCAPNADELFIKCQGVKYMSKLDLTASFWQIPLERNSRKYTAFMYRNKCYQYKVVPFGLVTSLAAMVRCLELALGPEIEQSVIVFVDDILVVSKSLDEHLEHLNTIFDKFRKANLVLNESKCEFMKSSMKFLGHIISADGVRTDPEKIRSITEFPIPTNVKGIRAFLGLTGYYRRFSEKYSNYINPLLQLLKQGVKWKWTAEHQRALQDVKRLFTDQMQLFHPEAEGTYVLYTDASDLAVGSVLYQRRNNGEHYVIAYANRTLKEAEKNYFTTEKEILAIVYALTKFRYYLYGHHFEIHTDNQALSFILKCRLTNARLTRWILAIGEYSFTIKYCKASENKIADVLSRYAPEEVEEFTPPTNEVKILAIEYQTPNELKQRLRNIHQEQSNDPTVTELRRKYIAKGDPRYRVDNDVLYKLWEGEWKVVLPNELLPELTWACHESLGHAGPYRCFLAIREDFICNNMFRKIRAILKVCHNCQTSKSPNMNTYIEMQNIIVQGKNEMLCVDFLGPLPRGTRRLKHLLVCTDAFTKIVRLYPVTRPTTKAVLNVIFNKYIPAYGQVKRVLSDQGKQFQNQLWSEKLTQKGIQPILTAIRRPQSNLAERVNKEIGKLFRLYCHDKHNTWPQYVNFFEKTLNENYNYTTEYTPQELATGQRPIRVWSKYIQKIPTANMTKPLHLKQAEAKTNIQRKADRRKLKFDAGHRLQRFQIGESVLLKTNPVGRSEDNTAKKFFKLFEGPYTLTERVGRNTFIVTDIAKNKSLGKYHGSSLRKYYARR